MTGYVVRSRGLEPPPPLRVHAPPSMRRPPKGRCTPARSGKRTVLRSRTHPTSFLRAGSITLTWFSPRTKRLNIAPNSRLCAWAAGPHPESKFGGPATLNGHRRRGASISNTRSRKEMARRIQRASKVRYGVGGRLDFCKRRGRSAKTRRPAKRPQLEENRRGGLTIRPRSSPQG